jgi:apolipoprotein D and lipocalin family protein
LSALAQAAGHFDVKRTGASPPALVALATLRAMNTVAKSLLAFVLVLLTACASTGKPPSLPNFAIEQLHGRWFVLANIPYSFERGKVGSFVDYVPRKEGGFDDLFYFREAELSAPLQRWTGKAWQIEPEAAPTRLKAQFVWPFSSEFWVFDVDAENGVVLLGTPDRDLFWLYARSPQISAEQYAAALTKAEQFGFVKTSIVAIPQHPSVELAVAGAAALSAEQK